MSESLALSVGDFQALDSHALGVGDRLRQVIDIARFVQGFDIAKFGNIMAQVKQIATADTLEAKVSAGIALLTTLASMTQTDVDDKIAALAKQLEDTGALRVVLPLVERLLLAKTQAVALAQEDLVALAEEHNYQATGFDLAAIMAIAKLLAELIAMFRQQ